MRPIAFLIALPAGLAAQSGPTYRGAGNELDIAIPRIEAAATVDGALDEPVWARAARLTGFTQYRPVDSRPADDTTQVLVWYGEDAIWFGIRAFERHGPVVRATLADRDNIGADDRIQILLDTYNDNRRALLFAVNPLGVQQDGVQSEGFDPGQSAGGRFDGVVDISPDFLYESRGRVTADGYEVEVRIPFKSLRYQSADPQTWGVQVVRFTQHSGYEDTWAPAVRGSASFLIQSGRLVGLTGLRRGLVMDIAPEFTTKLDGEPGPDDWRYGRPRSDIGGNLRWGVTSNLTLNATVNPDFSQVEADVGQVTVNERFALFFPEKRPFFLEGLERYDTPNRLIYTRRIVDPLGGVKLTGKAGATEIAYLGAADDDRFGSFGDDVPVYNLLRVRRDLGASSTIGAVHTDRIEGDAYNRVTGGDARIVWRRIWFSSAQLVGSWSRDPAGRRDGALWNITFADRTGRSYGNHYELLGITPAFEARSGFVPRTDLVTATVVNRFSWYGRPGARTEQLTVFLVSRPLWRHDDFASRGSLEGEHSATWIANLRGGWNARANASNTHQRFEEAIYGGYRLDRTVDTVPMSPPRSLYNLWGGSAGISSPNRVFTFSADAGVSQAVIFAEATEGRQLFASGSAFWRPTPAIRAELSMVHLRLDRASDGRRFSSANIPRLKLEYQLRRSIFVRYVGQYFSQERAALRDARTGQPLLPSAIGEAIFGGAGAFTINDFRNDVLFSYKPTAGTVFFLGYGASLAEPEPFRFNGDRMRRTTDGFFLKASYLFRL